MYRFGLIGFPIKQSLSPWIHENFLKRVNMQGDYSLIEIDPENNFKEEIDKLKTKELDGFNVTVPYKQKIIPYLDNIDMEAEKIGAVNTVVHKEGKWFGYNTDGKGYIRSLENKFPNAFARKDVRVLIVGAGGAARGIYYAFVTKGIKHIDITNRTLESAKDIAELALSSTSTSILSLTEAEKKVHQYDVIIQTTSVGMKPEKQTSIMSLDGIKKDSIISDIVYQPIETAFLKQARTLGAAIHYGHTMLLYQAQYAFEIWTNKRVPMNKMDKELERILKGR